MLEEVTTTLQDIQKKLVDILKPRTILIGHSLNSDLTALKLTHPFIIDTAIIFPHPRGPPLKSSLKWLAQRYLNREIQKGHGTTGPGAGHDSIEDARTCLDLVKQKCEKGKEWGTSDAVGENIFKRVARTGVRYKNQGGSAIPSPVNGKSSVAVDWGDPKKGAGNGATFTIGCKSDEEVMEGVIRAVKGDPDGKEIPGGGVDFVFGRLRELEALKGWWNNNKLVAAEAAAKDVVADATPAKEEPSTTDGKLEVAAGLKDTTDLDTKKDDITEDATAPTDVITPLLTTLEAASPTVPPTTTSPSSITPTTNSLPPPVSLDPQTPLKTAISTLSSRIQKIHASLPPCTALIIYSGSGDPREMSRLQAMQTQFKREYKIKKWDELSVKWTDVEEQALRRAVREAREGGLGFVGVK
jgi:RNA exonuclease 1